MSEGDLENLQKAIYRDKIERARKMTPLERFVVGQEMFESGCKQMVGNIRHKMPEASPEEIALELRRRLEIGRRLDRAQLKRTYAG